VEFSGFGDSQLWLLVPLAGIGMITSSMVWRG
jgi:hypothetical protein